MSRLKNSSRERPFVNPPPKKNEISTLVVERNPTDFELRLSAGRWVYVIYPVEDTGKYIKDSIDK
jgi:hypothetical protein